MHCDLCGTIITGKNYGDAYTFICEECAANSNIHVGKDAIKYIKEKSNGH